MLLYVWLYENWKLSYEVSFFINAKCNWFHTIIQMQSFYNYILVSVGILDSLFNFI